ncbi:DAK2 domain-containing protein [Candidatus Nephthysia bennettiae]|uniref:DAK2 domain-containing protein n=1 Tax=Candidatus Nephthysia bennettiae TaxID=3127016 RepID=A0A934NBQ9_9BACT|nr:DAK2 domain-containing protein [Candidatus Dormibacteraeota bacterium]MBJ7611098.1 DAK2 domain-containing protein [Candidatus Dormibacteraeota bacterium]
MKQALLGSLAWLSAHQEEINRLNVFPVPDGDTGTNMLLTLQSAVEDIKDSPATEVSKIARIAAHGSLMGARGNSGVILSQIFRGFGNAVQGKNELTPGELAEAFEEAANAAYRAVIKPTEGTILSVAREAGRAATAAAREANATPTAVIKAASGGARAAVEKTPSQLKILHEAGVVDAGGYGLQIMLDGMLRSVEEIDSDMARLAPPGPAAAAPPAAQAALDLPEEGWGYCTEFLVQGEGLDLERMREEIAGLGNSVLVVGESDLVKVHVHTDDPPRVIALASTYGRLDRLSVGDMSTQHRRLRQQAAADSEPEASTRPEPGVARAVPDQQRANGVGTVAVVSGPGLVQIFRGLGADATVEGGQTMNPSTQDMLAAVESVPYQDVVLLPNNRNVVLAARQVPSLSTKRVHVVATENVPQGIAALVAFNPERSAAENVRLMGEAGAHVQAIEVTHAVRDTRSNGLRVKKGDVIALINDKLKHTGGDYGSVVQDALTGIGAGDYELVTIYRGLQATDSEAERLGETIRGSFPGLEVELQSGGQEHYPFILSVE